MISQAIILAAGHGKRMRPLTEHTPKPLLDINGKTLIEMHIKRLSDAGIRHIIINTGRLGQQFEEKLGDGTKYGVAIRYSHEGDDPLETGGGIVKALTLFDEKNFIAVNGDIWTDYDFSPLRQRSIKSCHLVLVNNPEHNPNGDFAFNDPIISNSGEQKLTFSGIAAYSYAMFSDIAHDENTAFSLTPLLRQTIDNDQATAELYSGKWFDIGTPERLAELNRYLQPS